MKLAGIVFPAVAAIIAQASSCPPVTQPPGQRVEFEDGFEDGLGQWATGADVPADPNRPGEDVAWSITASTERSFQGGRSAKFSLDGRQDDGTIWLQRALAVDANRDYRATVSFEFWSESESFNTLAKVAAYAGTDAPTREEDFDTTKAANLESGWRTYSYTFDTHSSAAGRVWVALGISAVWETELTYYIDNLEIELRPR